MMIPAGTYSAHAILGVLSESGLKKTPQVVVDFEITTAEFAGEKITWYGFLTDKTTERTGESLRLAGYDGDDLEKLKDFDWTNAPNVELEIEHELYEGQTTAKVKWVNAPGGMRAAPLSADKAKIVSSKMRAVFAKIDQKMKGSNAADKPRF